MIKVKHVMEAVEPDDGKRLWVEPIGLTLDLQQWCAVHYVLPHFGPPRKVWDWFDERRGSEVYEHFRGVYHEHLDKGQLRKVLLEMVRDERVELYAPASGRRPVAQHGHGAVRVHE